MAGISLGLGRGTPTIIDFQPMMCRLPSREPALSFQPYDEASECHHCNTWTLEDKMKAGRWLNVPQKASFKSSNMSLQQRYHDEHACAD